MKGWGMRSGCLKHFSKYSVRDAPHSVNVTYVSVFFCADRYHNCRNNWMYGALHDHQEVEGGGTEVVTSASKFYVHNSLIKIYSALFVTRVSFVLSVACSFGASFGSSTLSFECSTAQLSPIISTRSSILCSKPFSSFPSSRIFLALLLAAPSCSPVFVSTSLDPTICVV